MVHTNRAPGSKVTDSSQCLNREVGWPSPLCGKQSMSDVMQDKPFIVSAQASESYSFPFIGRQVIPALGTQVFYAAGREPLQPILKIPTPTPSVTPTRTRTPTPTITPTITRTPTLTPTPTEEPPSVVPSLGETQEDAACLVAKY